MKVIKNKKVKYALIAASILIVLSVIVSLEYISSKKEEQRAKGVPLQVSKGEKELLGKFMGEFYKYMNSNDLIKAQALTKIKINDIHPGKQENSSETIEGPKAYSIKKLKDKKFKVVGSEQIKGNNAIISKRKSTYIVEAIESKYYITKFNYEFEKQILQPEISLIKHNAIVYNLSHGAVSLIGENIDTKDKKFTVALKYRGSKPQEFVHTFATINENQNKSNLKLLYAISDKGVKLLPKSTEVRREDKDVIVLFTGDAKEETDIARIDIATIENIGDILSGKVNLTEKDAQKTDFYFPITLIPKDDEKKIKIAEQLHQNIDIKPKFIKKTEGLELHIDSVTYDNTKGLVVKGEAISRTDRILNFDESSKEQVDQLKVYAPYQYEMVKFKEGSTYEKNLYQGIASAFVLKSNVKLTGDNKVIKLNLFNVPFYLDLKTGKEGAAGGNDFKELEEGSSFSE